MSVLEILDNKQSKKQNKWVLPIKVTVTNLNEAQKETLRAINEHNLVILQTLYAIISQKVKKRLSLQKQTKPLRCWLID